MKLNKNQRRFFEEAVEHFKEGPVDVRLKDINVFAEKEGLIVPTSALKNYCHEEGQVRGHYNLTLTGIEYIEPEPEYDHTPEIVKNFDVGDDAINDIINSTSAFVDPPKKKKKRRTVFDIMDLKPLKWHNPVYIMMTSDGDVVSLNETLEGAFKFRKKLLHDHGNREWNDLKKEIEYTGRATIDSINSELWCRIVVMELKK